MPPHPRVILFDIGGVLVELLGVPVMQEWTNGRFTVEELWRAWIHSPAVTAFETGGMESDEFAVRVIEEFRLPVEPDAFIEEFIGWPGRLYPGVVDLLAGLAPRYRLATLSNTNALHWPILTGDMGITDHIDTHFPSHITGLAKPHRDAYAHVIRELDVPAGDILFLDDNTVNVDAARDAGLNAHRAQGITGIREVFASLGIATS